MHNIILKQIGYEIKRRREERKGNQMRPILIIIFILFWFTQGCSTIPDDPCIKVERLKNKIYGGLYYDRERQCKDKRHKLAVKNNRKELEFKFLKLSISMGKKIKKTSVSKLSISDLENEIYILEGKIRDKKRKDHINSPKFIFENICGASANIRFAEKRIEHEKKVSKASGTINLSALNRLGNFKVNAQKSLKINSKKYKNKTGKNPDLSKCQNEKS